MEKSVLKSFLFAVSAMVLLSVLPGMAQVEIQSSVDLPVKKPVSAADASNGTPAFTRAADLRPLQVGANRTDLYFPLLEGKRVGMVTNSSGVIEFPNEEGLPVYRYLLDSLLDAGIKVKKIFCPEHGFRGEAEAGATVENSFDLRTGIPIISLYGVHKKPAEEDFAGIDIILFDLQDVGVRFYTYISTLHYVMQACAEQRIPVVLLDRPNPHTAYIDGPLLDTVEFRSFVGMHPVPVVYGMTIGEYARMINGEGWLETDSTCPLTVVPLLNYYRGRKYEYPVPPSPNLQDMVAINAYPSLCFFEGTDVSVGRGTYFPFHCYGFAGCPVGNYQFTPKSMQGFALHPPYENKLCNGFWLDKQQWSEAPRALDLKPLLTMYNAYPKKEKFFNTFFDNLAGGEELQQQIRDGKTEEEIRDSWKKGLKWFAEIRQKYLLY